MLTVSQIANSLEKTIYQVHHYIKNGHLIAEKKDRMYLIKEDDYNSFLEEYYYVRHNKKGIKPIPTTEHIDYLYRFVNDCMNESIDYKTFSNRYKDINTLLPPLDKFILAIRNRNIIKDLKTMRQIDVADKYNLKLITIKTISSKSKERSN